MRKKTLRNCTAFLLVAAVLTGCASGSTQTPDDYATNEGYTSTEDSAQATDSGQTGISKDDMKVGVLYISDPSEGSGYSYTHDLGIQGMQENLGLNSDQIERKIVDDSDAVATEKAIKECIDEINPKAFRTEKNDPYFFIDTIKNAINEIKKYRLTKESYFYNIEIGFQN